ncbi:acVLRF1 family peptidyl-tRNA hydrolase [Paenarthrobacter sp. NPDC089322]|uniref:acVLRF1 family peptidyl-tRNA hydrolase n=1 Tax=Paenarthrobacter sp. NPDC089322 TaxID=3155065 RepID=UPI0034123655
MDRPRTIPQRQPTSRTALVPAARLHGWVERFAASHGPLGESSDDGSLLLRAADGSMLLRAADGATALLRAPWPADGRPGRGATDLDRLASLATQERGLGILLVRRGGYAVAAASGSTLLASKSGDRYVQGRTAAGGQSQQRYARRRSNQADALVVTAAEHAARIFADYRIEYIVPGGDRSMVEHVLAQPALQAVARRTRLPFLDVQEPRTAALPKAATDACCIRITVTDAPT